MDDDTEDLTLGYSLLKALSEFGIVEELEPGVYWRSKASDAETVAGQQNPVIRECHGDWYQEG